MRLSRVSLVISFVLGLVLSTQTARAECNCVAVASDVAAGVQAEVAKADGLYARADFSGALTIYASAYASSKDAVLLYAQGMANLQLGARDKAKAMFQAYLGASGTLAYKDRAQAQLGMLGGVGNVVGGVGGEVSGAGGAVVGGAVDTTAGLHGDVKGKAKIGHKAGVILAVIAVAALGALAVQAIAAGVKDDIELDAKFDIGMGIAGVAVGISAIYVAGLTATTGAAAGAPCVSARADNAKPIGLAAGFRF